MYKLSKKLFNYLLSLFFVSSFFTIAASAQVLNLGFGYQCDLASGNQGIVIDKHGNIHDLLSAKKSVKNIRQGLKRKIRKLRLEKDKSKKVKLIKKRLKTVSDLNLAIENCFQPLAIGTLSAPTPLPFNTITPIPNLPDSHEKLVTLIDSLKGSYSGEYNDTFFGPGPMNITLQRDLNIVTASIRISDEFETFLGVEPIKFSKDITGLTLPLIMQSPGTKLGDFTIRISADNSVFIESTNIPPIGLYSFSVVRFNGMFLNNLLSGNYVMLGQSAVVFFQGSFNLYK